jgi:hypothetical protein
MIHLNEQTGAFESTLPRLGKDVPRGTMDEVRSYVYLDLPSV